MTGGEDGGSGIVITTGALSALVGGVTSWIATFFRYRSQIRESRRSVEERLADVERWQAEVNARLKSIEENVSIVRRFLIRDRPE